MFLQTHPKPDPKPNPDPNLPITPADNLQYLSAFYVYYICLRTASFSWTP